MKTFDELYDEFFGGDKPKKSKKTNKDLNSKNLSEEMLKMIESLSKFREITNPDEQFEIDNEYGPADKVEFFTEDDLFFKRSTWVVEDGEIVKLEVSDAPFQEEEIKTLEELLQDALESENYELAAEIRDEMNKNKKN
jgi:excinuclease UvrABC helicase subunit UvrB